MPIIDFRQDVRVDDYYRQIPKWVSSNKGYRRYLYEIGDHATLKKFNYNLKRLEKEVNKHG